MDLGLRYLTFIWLVIFGYFIGWDYADAFGRPLGVQIGEILATREVIPHMIMGQPSPKPGASRVKSIASKNWKQTF
jgi:hypothetical protein